MSNVSSVVNNLIFTKSSPSPDTAEPEAEQAAEDGASLTESGRTFTVKSGDTLWKIAQEMYGNGSKYMKIFAANTPMLDNPDRICPGQKLNIPNSDT